METQRKLQELWDLAAVPHYGVGCGVLVGRVCRMHEQRSDSLFWRLGEGRRLLRIGVFDFTSAGHRGTPKERHRLSPAGNPLHGCRRRKASGAPCHRLRPNPRRRLPSRSGLVTESPRRHRPSRRRQGTPAPSARCMVLIETCPLVVWTFSSSTLCWSPASSTAARARSSSAGERTKIPISCDTTPSLLRFDNHVLTAFLSSSMLSKTRMASR